MVVNHEGYFTHFSGGFLLCHIEDFSQGFLRDHHIAFGYHSIGGIQDHGNFFFLLFAFALPGGLWGMGDGGWRRLLFPGTEHQEVFGEGNIIGSLTGLPGSFIPARFSGSWE